MAKSKRKTQTARAVPSTPPATRATRSRRAPTTSRSGAQSPFARYRVVILGGIAAIAVVVFALAFLSSSGPAYACQSLLTPPPAASSDPAALGFATEDLGRAHVEPPGTKITYAFCPPTSGGHWSAAGRGPIRNAVYGAASEQAPGGWVHNLEHGAVVLLYRCPSGTLGSGECATVEDMTAMRQWFDDAPVVNNCPKQAIVARFDEMSTRFAVVAWNRALLSDTFDLAQASAFADQWTDVTAPEAERLVCS